MGKFKSALLRKIDDTASTWIPLSELPHVTPEEISANKCQTRIGMGGRAYVTFDYYAYMEQDIAKELVGRVRPFEQRYPRCDVLPIIKKFEAQESKRLGVNFKLADEQVDAVITLAGSQIAILTGGPGTGKTSVLKCLVYVLKSLYPKCSIEFTAPTGKAARRITESTGYKAMTLQKRIGDRGELDLNQTEYEPIYSDFLITDEVSMLDMKTFRNALFALSRSSCWYLVGDVDQLPSVGIGCVLRDLVDSGAVPVAQLVKTFRQDNSSVLFQNIQQVRTGLCVPLVEGPDFRRIKTEENALQTTVDEYLKGVEKYGLDNVVVLTPYRKAGKVCSEKLNKILQDQLNPYKEGQHYVRANIERDGRELKITFREGDPVIQLLNVAKVANGDVGKIKSIEGKRISVQYSDCIVDYYPDTYDQLDLAYALSIHKSQGSEYKLVIIPFLAENKNLDRNMVYTGITRAKKECVVIGDDKVIMDACKLQSAWVRETYLCEALQRPRLTEWLRKTALGAKKGGK